jgi:hypothetical protein
MDTRDRTLQGGDFYPSRLAEIKGEGFARQRRRQRRAPI